ncbi:MAG TPA: EAL domain-containing protein [Actinomycetes bacterium]|nr:EAL domain-containing protein [Actinomycetes bacterium]
MLVRHRSRLATVGLAVVLVLLAGFSLWASTQTRAAARHVDRDSAEQQGWQTARLELAEAQAAQHSYVRQQRPQSRADITRANIGLRISLRRIEQHADPEDAAFARQVAGNHQRYVTATSRLLAAVAAGDEAEASAIEAREVEPAFAEVAERLADGARDEQEQVTQSLAALQELGETLVVAVPVVFAAGLGLLVGCWALLVGYQRHIEHQALSDALTGLPNRALLHDRTGQAIRLADREMVPSALLLIDLDRFKEVNDTLGHHYGDQLLVQVGQRLRAGLRQVDTVARLGGDEFAVLLPRIETREGAVTVARKLQAVLEEPFPLDGLTIDVEASIGVALYPDHASDPEGLLQRADIAMYTAKETHAGFVVFDPKQDQHSPRRLALLGELRRALEQQQLLLHYQPKVDAHTGQVLGVEALVRWQHPEHGLVPPDEFIPLAERTGLIGPLTSYVMDAALRQCRQWHEAGHELSVAVNVSARRLLDLQFPDEVGALLARHRVSARLLVVELTESTIMADPVHALEILGRLNAMGVQLSIDDFGTGYSSMAYLKHLPVHELKIDRSFVSRMISDSSDAVIVHCTVDLGRNLGLRVVAEGVEDPLTLQQLDLLGCHAVQGYHISRPVAADALTTWLNGRPASAAAPA